VWDYDSGSWGPILEHVDGIWVDCSGIDRIDFRAHRRQRAQQLGHDYQRPDDGVPERDRT